jgi:hypothetical protein
MGAEKMNKIICDIDSTITDHWNRIRRNTVPKWPGGMISNKAWLKEEVLKDKILPHCKSVLDALHGRDFEIKYLSARGWSSAGEISEEQLTRLGVPNPWKITIVSNMQEKIDKLTSRSCDFYIDDFLSGQEGNIGTFRGDIARAIEAKGIRVIVFRNDWLDVLYQINYYVSGEKQWQMEKS